MGFSSPVDRRPSLWKAMWMPRPPTLASTLLAALFALAPSSGRSADPAPPVAAPPEPVGRTTGMVFGTGHLFTVQAPRGWMIQGKGEGGNGLATVFYPMGSTFAEASAVLYVNTATREKGQRLEDFIARDVAGMRKDSPAVKVEKGRALETGDRKRAEVRTFIGDKWGNRESIAFLAEDSIFVTIVLTARTAESYKAALPAFADLVGSYRFVTKDVKVNK
jgi:hypothetical protein